MGIVTSFIPGRIRLRSRIFRDDDIASAFTSLLDATGIVTGIERNANTGSFLVSYRAECIPSAENLIRFASIPSAENLIRFASTYMPQLARLKFRILYYTPQDKGAILSAISQASAALPEIKRRLLLNT